MLIFHLKKEWFEKVKSGEKTHEYRVYNDYWKKRINKLQKDIEFRKQVLDITSTHPDKVSVCFMCGYPSYDDNDKILYKVVKNISVVDGKNTDLKIDRKVFDIDFGEAKDEKQKI